MRTIEQMVHQEILCCMSSLVSTLAKGAGLPISAEYLSRETRADLTGLFDQAYELTVPVLDYEEAAIQEGWTQCPDGRWWRAGESEDDPSLFESFLGSYPFIFQDTAEDACACDSLDPYRCEVFEHWAVSQRLAEKLIAQGERVDTDFAGLNIWACTTTGQAISMDGVIQRIYKEMMK